MKPTLFHQTDDQPVLRLIVSCLTNIDCSKHFTEHIGKSQSEQKSIVSEFQDFTRSALQLSMPKITWSIEHCPSRITQDSIDIFGRGHDFVVAIELDKNRADQVAKKFVSRMAILPATTIYFISLCYPGTERMNKRECIKYFGYCATLARRTGNHYASFIIE